jgi:hypothetical protein
MAASGKKALDVFTLEAYDASMLTWYVVCQLTSHDHLYKISLRDSD